MVTLADAEEKSICQHHADWQKIFFSFFKEYEPQTQTEITSFVERKSACPGHLGWKKINWAILVFPWVFHENGVETQMNFSH